MSYLRITRKTNNGASFFVPPNNTYLNYVLENTKQLEAKEYEVSMKKHISTPRINYVSVISCTKMVLKVCLMIYFFFVSNIIFFSPDNEYNRN